MAVETEIKISICSEAGYNDFKHLLEAKKYPLINEVTQENNFFDDSADSFSKKKIGIRLRIINAKKYVLTVKTPLMANPLSGLSRHRELEYEMPAADGRALLADPSSLATVIRDTCNDADLSSALLEIITLSDVDTSSRMVHVGSFTNHRSSYTYHGHVLELDASIFPLGPRWEIEVEVEDGDEAAVGELRRVIEGECAEAGAEWMPSTMTKLGRFRKELAEVKMGK